MSAETSLHLVEQFRNGSFPLPQQFTIEQLEVIGNWPANDSNLAQKVLTAYGLQAMPDENPWEILVEYIRDERAAFPTWPKHNALQALADAVRECVALGVAPEDINTQPNRDGY